MATAERELRAAQNQMLFRSVNDRIRELGENLLNSVEEVDFACECANPECIEPIPMPVSQFAALEGVENRFVVLRCSAAMSCQRSRTSLANATAS